MCMMFQKITYSGTAKSGYIFQQIPQKGSEKSQLLTRFLQQLGAADPKNKYLIIPSFWKKKYII